MNVSRRTYAQTGQRANGETIQWALGQEERGRRHFPDRRAIHHTHRPAFDARERSGATHTRARSRYSERSAADGVSAAAREAGTSVASSSVDSSTAIAPTMASGSEVCVPYSSERT